MKKVFFLLSMLLIAKGTWAQLEPCASLDAKSDDRVVYGLAMASALDSLSALEQARELAKQQINTQVAKQLKNVVTIYVQGFNSQMSYNDLMKLTARVVAASDRVMDKTSTTCAYVERNDEQQFDAQLIEQLPVETIFQYIESNYFDAIQNMDRFKTIYTSNLQYE